MKRVAFDPAARAELVAAVERYERDYPGRGLRLATAVQRAVRSAAATPGLGALFPGVPERLGVRRRIVIGFPFVLAYRELDDMIRIDAVAHTRRRPRYWLGRVGD